MSHTNRLVPFAIAILFTLSGCGGSSSDSAGTGGGVSGAVTTGTLSGTWKSACFDDDTVNVILNFTITATTITGTADQYDITDTDCTNMIMQDVLGNVTYTLGSNVTVDGSVGGITTATEIDITDPGPPPETEYDIIAIYNNKLYLGDTDGANDGTSPAKRPTQLDDEVLFTKQ